MGLKGDERASLVAQRLKGLPAMQETWVQSLGQEDPLEKELTTHSSILACEIPWTGVPDRPHSVGLQRVRHAWGTKHTHICLNMREKEGCLYEILAADVWLKIKVSNKSNSFRKLVKDRKKENIWSFLPSLPKIWWVRWSHWRIAQFPGPFSSP